MITQAFLALLLDTLAETIPAGQDREAGRAIARALLEALRPTDAKEAAQAARAIAAHFAAMDCFARAAKPGMSDETVIKLRSNALAASRLSDALMRPPRHQPRPTASTENQPLGSGAASPAMPASQVRHRAELPLSIPGLPDTVIRTTRREAWRSETALAPVSPTVPVPG
jgi:hypothetical protein